MAGRVRYLLSREGRYYARLVVPKDLRPHLEGESKGKTELRTPLGADYRQALKALPGAVAKLQHRIAVAERGAARTRGVRVGDRARYPMRPEALARAHYQARLLFDEELRGDPRYALGLVDDGLVAQLRAGIAGRLTNEELAQVIGSQVERFRALGNVDAPAGSDEWRVIARALCVGELEALGRVMERDEGDYSGVPEHPMLAKAEEPDPLPPVSLRGLFKDYVKARNVVGRGRSIENRWAPVVESLVKHMKGDDARRITNSIQQNRRWSVEGL